MKVCINKCYGGFGLSQEAIRALAKTNCDHLSRFKPEVYYSGSKDWKADFKKAQEPTKSTIFPPLIVINGLIVQDDHRNGSRNCPHLIDIVSKMGDKANGVFASLKIVEIPDDIKFEIDEYDGAESVSEVHRSWG